MMNIHKRKKREMQESQKICITTRADLTKPGISAVLLFSTVYCKCTLENAVLPILHKAVPLEKAGVASCLS